VTGKILLLAPSRGLGGGIERYVQTLEWAFTAQGIAYERVDLHQPGPLGHLRLLSESSARLGVRELRASPERARVIVAHRALLPAALMLARRYGLGGISVICHGSEIWGSRVRPRAYAESRLMRRNNVRVVAVSSFTAGSLASGRAATILPPGVSGDWFDQLSSAAVSNKVPRDGVELLTAFRLTDWRDKGLPQLLEAIDALDRGDVFLTVCGSGKPPADLLRLVRARPWCTLLADLSDSELAHRLAGANLFVLATRTRLGRHPCGEGFGLVLLEAQLAGTPVVAPAYGGSADALVHGVTGMAPADEGPAALTRLLDELLKDPSQLSRMGTRAAEWARESFAPSRYAALAVDRLL